MKLNECNMVVIQQYNDRLVIYDRAAKRMAFVPLVEPIRWVSVAGLPGAPRKDSAPATDEQDDQPEKAPLGPTLFEDGGEA